MTTAPPATDAELLEYMEGLALLERDEARIPVFIGPYSAITMTGALQLVLRHPDVSDAVKTMIRQWIDQIRPTFAGTLGQQIIELGDDPANDV